MSIYFSQKPLMHINNLVFLLGADKTSVADMNFFDPDPSPKRLKISKYAAILGTFLAHRWRESRDKDGFCVIKNCLSLQEVLGYRIESLKHCLLALGGFAYPPIDLEGKTSIDGDFQKIFDIKVKFKLIGGLEENDFGPEKRIGTNYLSFLKGRALEEIAFQPSLRIQEELGKLPEDFQFVYAHFFDFAKNLSNLAYRLFCWSRLNAQTFELDFEKIVFLFSERDPFKKRIGNEKYYVKNGKKVFFYRELFDTLRPIKISLEELLKKNHLKKMEYNKVDKKIYLEY